MIRIYVIVVYDVKEKRVVQVNKYLKQFLTWIQNSVFEGEITQKNLMEMKKGIERIIETKEDAVIIYELKSEKVVKRRTIGKEKNVMGKII